MQIKLKLSRQIAVQIHHEQIINSMIEVDGWSQWKRQAGFFVFIINFQRIQYHDLDFWI